MGLDLRARWRTAVDALWSGPRKWVSMPLAALGLYDLLIAEILPESLAKYLPHPVIPMISGLLTGWQWAAVWGAAVGLMGIEFASRTKRRYLYLARPPLALEQ